MPSKMHAEKRAVRGRIIGQLLVVGALAAGTALVLGPSGTAAATHKSQKSFVLLAETQNATLGTILVNDKGFTVYTFAMDTPNTSHCSGVCAKVWRPLVLPKGDNSIKPVNGVRGLGVTHHGKLLQATFDKKPLYLFNGDTAPGMAAGEGFEFAWFAVVLSAKVTPATAVSPPAPASPPANTNAGATSGSTNGSSGGNSSPPPTPPPAPTPTPPPAPTPTPPPAPTPPPGGGVGYGY